MFKFVILAALCSLAAARPGLVHTSPLIHESSVAHVGSVLRSVPSAVSHQSQTIVHGQDHVVEPIVAPVVKSYATAPIVSTYSAAAPIVGHSVPLTYSSPYTYAAAPVHFAASSPLTYTAATAW